LYAEAAAWHRSSEGKAVTRSVRVFVIIYIFAGGLRGCPEAGAVKVRAKKLAKHKPLSIGSPVSIHITKM
jgi:hypothetical protein